MDITLMYTGRSGKRYPVIIPQELNQALMKLTPWDGKWCDSKQETDERCYNCNRPYGHIGQHLATFHADVCLREPTENNHAIATWL
jgi:hypothetical protein